MSFTNTCRFLAAIIFIFSKPSLSLANQRNSSGNVDLPTVGKSTPRRPRPASSGTTTALCETSVPILPPTLIATKYQLYSVRALMFLQILPDGKINGTSDQFSEYAKLRIEVLNKWCMVRIKGVASQRYLVMQPNGTLISQTQPDKEGSIFNLQIKKDFFSFENGNHFIAFKHGGEIKKVTGDVNGRSSRRSTRFLFVKRASRKRRFPSSFNFIQSMGDSDPRKLFGDLRRR